MKEENNYYNNIKNKLISNEITNRVKDYSKNRSDLNTYYEVGRLLSEAGKHYGEGIIKEYSKRLTNELGKGYTETNLKYFRQFYYFSKRHTLCDELTWSHYRTLLPILNLEKVKYYIFVCKKYKLSVRQLKDRIKSNEYERLPEETKLNFSNNSLNDYNINDFIKNPIIIKNVSYDVISEEVLQKLILENIIDFMKELGDSFAFIGNEYKIKIGKGYNYIDLLFYNYKFKCFVVVELKVIELKKEHIGQIEVYMNYIDKNIKGIDDNNTIGIIIVRKNNKDYIEYCSDPRILVREFELE